jgi:hypothetical protein
VPDQVELNARFCPSEVSEADRFAMLAMTNRGST